MRSIGTATASAVAAVLLAQYVVTTGGHDYTTATGFRLAFAAAGVAALVALTIAWFLPRHEKVYPDASVPIAPDASVPVDPEVCTPVVAETGAPVDEQAGGRSVDGSPAGAIPGSPPIRVPTARGDR